MEDVAYFECKKVDKKELFVTYCMGSPIKSFMIDEKIIGVHVVRDTISFVDNNYELCIDEGLEIITQDNKYSLVRYGEFFIEEISYRIGEDIEDIYPVKRVIENWMPFEPCRISVSREIIEL